MAVHRERVEFDQHDLSELVPRFEALGEGAWINIEPLVSDEDLAQLRHDTAHPLTRLFSKKGGPIPFGTIVVEGDNLAVGLEHAHGARVVGELRAQGVSAPSSWRLEQDHPRRGLVYAVSRDEQPEVVLRWILAAATALAGVPVRGRWSAVFASPR